MGVMEKGSPVGLHLFPSETAGAAASTPPAPTKKTPTGLHPGRGT